MTVHATNIIARPRFTQPSPINILGTIAFWVARSKQRRILATLELDRLTDMGITPEQADGEAAKMFWQA